MSYAAGNYAGLLLYFHIFINFRKIYKFIFEMAMLLNEFQSKGIHHNLTKRLKNSGRIIILIIIFVNIWKILLSVFTMESLEAQSFYSWSNLTTSYSGSIRLFFYEIIYVAWVLANGTFTVFYTCFVILVCKMMLFLLEQLNFNDNSAKFQQNRVISLAERQLYHRKVSNLVRQANEIFSFALFLNLFLEIVKIMSGFQASVLMLERGIWTNSFGLVLFIWNSLVFISEALACSAVNEKVI